MTEAVYKELYETQKNLEHTGNVLQAIIQELAEIAGVTENAPATVRDLLDGVRAAAGLEKLVVEEVEQPAAE